MSVRLLPIVLACALTAAGCGGDSGNGSPAAGTDLTVQMRDYEFDPRDVNLAPGAVIHVTNEGQIAHNLKIERGPDPTEETQELAGTDSFLPGDSENLEIALPRGRYAMVCTVPGHRELGMTGRLRVR
ncbi:MAG TPA: plastocyanin/azurin family copper-binding protein [Solirubrobacterales bacterium]|nr:plastocyanin/azurin family copper-binding protein [Solirubrobacterales bacterium]